MRGARDIETNSLILSADEADLVGFIEALRRFRAANICLVPGADRPVFRAVIKLGIRPSTQGSLHVAIEGDSAEIAGDAESFGLFADELCEFLGENDLNAPGMHAHFDPDEKQFNGLRVSRDSVELIVTGPVPED